MLPTHGLFLLQTCNPTLCLKMVLQLWAGRLEEPLAFITIRAGLMTFLQLKLICSQRIDKSRCPGGLKTFSKHTCSICQCLETFFMDFLALVILYILLIATVKFIDVQNIFNDTINLYFTQSSSSVSTHGWF